MKREEAEKNVCVCVCVPTILGNATMGIINKIIPHNIVRT